MLQFRFLAEQGYSGCFEYFLRKFLWKEPTSVSNVLPDTHSSDVFPGLIPLGILGLTRLSAPPVRLFLSCRRISKYMYLVFFRAKTNTPTYAKTPHSDKPPSVTKKRRRPSNKGSRETSLERREFSPGTDPMISTFDKFSMVKFVPSAVQGISLLLGTRWYNSERLCEISSPLDTDLEIF